MKTNVLLKFLCFICLCTFASKLIATVYNLTGNNTTNYISVPQAVVDTAARGFVFFSKGATFNGTVNVSLPVPINGFIRFGNGGTCRVNLEADLTLGSTVANGTPNRIFVGTTNGSADIDGRGGSIIFNGDTFFRPSRALNILSDLIIDGREHDIVISPYFTFTVQSGAKLTIQNAQIRNLQDLNFVGNGRVILSNVIVMLDNDWTFSGNASIGTPELCFDKYVRISGKNKKFTYSGGRNLILSSDAILTIDPTVTFSWASQRRYGIVMDNQDTNVLYTTAVPGSILYFNKSTFYIPSHGPFSGINLQKGNILFDNTCTINNEANTDQARSLQLGDASSSANNTDVDVLPGALVTIDGYIYDASV